MALLVFPDVKWWYEHRSLYPHLLCMALDYLTVPDKHFINSRLITLMYLTATSVNVERLFSKGCILLPHLHNHLLLQNTCILLCLGHWSKLGLVKNKDLHKAACEAEVLGDQEIDLPEGWDKIDLDG